jgi:ABC-type sugar transport system permease subunit
VLFAVVAVPLTLVVGTLVGLLLNRLGPKMAAFVSTSALLAWSVPPVAASVLFYWLFNPDGGLVDWTLARMPRWLVGDTNWAGFNWTTSDALHMYTVLLLFSVIWDFNIFTQTYLLAGFPGNRDEFNLSLYIYDKAFQFPPSYSLGGALALIFTLILLVVTAGYVRASVRQGALT